MMTMIAGLSTGARLSQRLSIRERHVIMASYTTTATALAVFLSSVLFPFGMKLIDMVVTFAPPTKTLDSFPPTSFLFLFSWFTVLSYGVATLTLHDTPRYPPHYELYDGVLRSCGMHLQGSDGSKKDRTHASSAMEVDGFLDLGLSDGSSLYKDLVPLWTWHGGIFRRILSCPRD